MPEFLPWSTLTAGMAVSPVPVWLLDMETIRVHWANSPALALWAAPSLTELCARDMMSGAPPKIVTRLQNAFKEVRAGQLLQEEWAFYPAGEPAMVLLHLQGVTLDDGRLVMLNQALPVSDAAPPSLLRGITALRHTSLIIAFVTADGRIRMQNPAAMETFSEDHSWFSWLVDAAQAQHLLAQALRNEPVQVETAVATRAGRRFHCIDLHALRDPVSGEPGALIEHVDVTARITAEGTAAERLRIVQSQHQEILALAAPILDVGRSTIAVPVIGELNPERCQLLAERLLYSLVERRARRVIIDLTGISGSDSAGVASLCQLLEAIRLLGASPLLTGISAQLAQQLTHSGTSLAQFATRRTLADAISQLSASES